MLVLMVNDQPICIYNDTKEFTPKIQILVSTGTEKCFRGTMEPEVCKNLMLTSIYSVSEALFCTCAHQYLDFWGKLFWALLCTSNMMCSVHCMMVLPMVSLRNGWYMVKICMHHSCVPIKGNTVLIDVNSFVSLYMHIGWSLTMRTNIYIGWNICYTQFNLCYSSVTLVGNFLWERGI